MDVVKPTLYDFLPRDERADNDFLFSQFLDYVSALGLELYHSQEEAILELFQEKNVILNTPTGSGKSLVALALHFKSLAQGKRSVYTCPIKALVNEKWLSLCKEFGARNVGLSTGDATVNKDAPILCCTAEILANIALREGETAQINDVIIDEFHWYSDRDRGVAWQIPLLTLPQARFLLMSATLGDTSFFETELTRLNGLPTVTIKSDFRPVPLEFSYIEKPLVHTVEQLLQEDKAPIYVVHFSQAEAAQSAQDFMCINVCSREEKNAIARAIEGVKFNSPYGPSIRNWLKHGIGLHHAGLLPRYRVLVEKLSQQGLLKIICGTDTLGVGVNVPIRTVLFTRLSKYDGQKTGILSVRDFHQIAGRAGRKGFDERGWVVALAPEHVIENKKLEEKAAKDGKKVKKRKAPENFVGWDEKTFYRLVNSKPEQLVSQFTVSHGMLINVLSRKGDSCKAMQKIISRCHEPPKAKKEHFKRAWQLFRALLDKKIIEFIPKQPDGSHLRINIELQEDFSMNQTLSLYLIETIQKLDPAAPDYHLNVLTLVESILEDPEIILQKQLDKLKSQKIAEMKAEGKDYEERMAELEKLEYPKPLRDFIYSTFNEFADKHPWVGNENIRPKSIAREMYESLMTFDDYIYEYDLQRAEGLLLRHLSNVHKVLAQTVPDSFKTFEVMEMEQYFKTMIRQVDSSLLEEWEKMRKLSLSPVSQVAQTIDKTGALPEIEIEKEEDITADHKKFLSDIRNIIFVFLRNWSVGNDQKAIASLESLNDIPDELWETEQYKNMYEELRKSRDDYFKEHSRLSFEPEARNIRHTVVSKKDENVWIIQQTLVDIDGFNDWFAEFVVDIEKSKKVQKPVIKFSKISPIGK
jgi:superfamily II RNA helicase